MSRLHRPKAGFWIRLCVVVIYPCIDALLFRLRWRNLDRVTPPDRGGVIIAINHISHVDTLLMARLVWQSGRVPRFLIKAGLFAQPVVGPDPAGREADPRVPRHHRRRSRRCATPSGRSSEARPW